MQDLLNHPENTALLAECPIRKNWHNSYGLKPAHQYFPHVVHSQDGVCRRSRPGIQFCFHKPVAEYVLAQCRLGSGGTECDHSGTQTGDFLESGLRSLYRMFTEGLTCTEINMKPLGGALFGQDATPLLSKLKWGELAVAHLLNCLLWTPKQRGAVSRERVHYGSLTVQDLGRVYESLIELDPGITTQIMCRLRRRKLEVVVPISQGEKYRSEAQGRAVGPSTAADPDEAEDDADDETDSGRGKKTAIDWIEEIPAGRFSFAWDSAARPAVRITPRIHL